MLRGKSPNITIHAHDFLAISFNSSLKENKHTTYTTYTTHTKKQPAGWNDRNEWYDHPTAAAVNVVLWFRSSKLKQQLVAWMSARSFECCKPYCWWFRNQGNLTSWGKGSWCTTIYKVSKNIIAGFLSHQEYVPFRHHDLKKGFIIRFKCRKDNCISQPWAPKS